MRFLTAACLLTLGPVAELVACSCPPPPPPKKALEFSTAVFLAEVVGIETEGEERTVSLRVEKWWKGGEAAEVTVSTSKSGASCGYGFEKGKKYLVYAHREEGQKTLHVSLCSRTRTEKEAEKDGDFKELGEGKKPEAKEPEGKKPVGLAAFVEAARLQKEARDRAEYFRTIQRAYEAWQADDMRRTRELLDGIPPERRAWEWFYLSPSPKK